MEVAENRDRRSGRELAGPGTALGHEQTIQSGTIRIPADHRYLYRRNGEALSGASGSRETGHRHPQSTIYFYVGSGIMNIAPAIARQALCVTSSVISSHTCSITG